MFKQLKHLVIIGSVGFSAIVFADSNTDSNSWVNWLQSQVTQHPSIIASREAMQAQLSLADGAGQPLYNPELETEFEREGQDNNYKIGFRQTIDLRNKRETQQQQAQYQRLAARQQLEWQVQQQTVKSLQALIDWKSAKAKSDLATQQEQQLKDLLQLVQKRQQAGDINPVAAELAFLGLSQTLSATAQSHVQLRQSEAQLRALLGKEAITHGIIPNSFWSASIDTSNPQQWINKHPAIEVAQALWRNAQTAATLSEKQARADPSFGLSAGESSGDNVVSINFSIPLQVRNNYRYQTSAARQQSLSAEASLHALRRQQLANIESSLSALKEYQQRFQSWQSLMQGRSQRSDELLRKYWSSGEMSTNEYLLALQQLNLGLVAGIDLRHQYQTAYLDYLLQSAQIHNAINTMKTRN